MTSEIKTGQFSVTPECTVLGELRVDAQASTLVLRDYAGFDTSTGRVRSLRGVLYDQTRITLVNCIRTSVSTRSSTSGSRSQSTNLFPHFVVEGRTHIDPDAHCIREISFTFEDATALFHDFDAFGSVMEPERFIASLTEAQAKLVNRAIRTGPEPHIAYFAGQRLIVEADTLLGRISVEHLPLWPIGGPKGVHIENEIAVKLTPSEPIDFNEAVDRVLILLRFLTVATGRRQNVAVFSIEIPEHQALSVQWSHYPRREDGGRDGQAEPHPRDLPFDPIANPREFVDVLRGWLSTDKARLAARVRADQGFALQNSYSIERLIGAASSFDLLPESALAAKGELSATVEAARDQCKAIAKALPVSYERESLLRAIGRLGQASLKQKVRHRTQIITDACKADHFPFLEMVCSVAVDCRNFFVHGANDSDLEVADIFRLMGFFTDTLEFVFYASQLVEFGWNLDVFLKRGTTMTHPFGEYNVNYRERLKELEAARKKS